MNKDNAIENTPTSRSTKSLLAEVDIPNAAFRELLWLSGAKLPPDTAIDPARIDWPKLIRLAYEERLLTVFHSVILQQLEMKEEYARYLPLLRTAHLDNVKRNLALASETLRLLDALEAEGIPTIAFKGCVLSVAVYGSLAARKAGDIDLLVRKPDVRKAAQVLADCGYQPFRERTAAELRGLLALDCEWELVNQEKYVGLDLHWEFNGRNSGLFMPLDDIWSRQQFTTFCGRTIRCLSREDLILMLCLHATKHHLQTLEWIYTIARVVNHSPNVDWEMILKEAKLSKTNRLLNLGLLMSNEIYGLSLPEKVHRQVCSDARARELACRALQWMYCGARYLPDPPDLRKYYADTRPDLYSKAQYWLHATFTPTAKDYITNMPPELDWCYYIIRGCRLISEKVMHYLAHRSAPPRHVIEWIPEPEILRAINGREPDNSKMVDSGAG